MTLRKEGKARWIYECQLCQHKSDARQDQLRAQEAGLRHEETGNHIGAALTAALEPMFEAVKTVANAYMDMAKSVTDAFSAVFDPPQNVPHDPAQRRDKRVWGGR